MLRGTGALVLAGLLALGAVGATGSYALKSPGVIRITDVEVSRELGDVGKPGRSVGDVEVRRLTLYNKRITPRPIGRALLLCTYAGGNSSSCTGTFFLPKGEIVAGGAIGSKLFYALAVFGGTGLYNNVRGTLTATSLGVKPPRELLLFRLVT